MTILILFILAASGSIFVFSIDKWHIEIDCGKENDIKTEYGEAYDDTAATAALKGRYLLKNGFPAAVTSEGSVDTSKLGNYTITYHASFLFWKSEATKTVHVVDTIPPEIKLVTDPDHYTLPGHPYEEEGYSATDNVDGDLTKEVTSEEKDGNVIYKVSDSSGNETTITRKIFYDDPIPPTLTLKGDSEMTIQAGSDYKDPGYTAADNVDGDLTSKVTVEGSVNTYSAGTYTLTYTVKDNYGNEASDTRTVTVEPVRQSDTVNPTGKIVYLTFDDGPSPLYTERLLDGLKERGVVATFFVTGENAESCPDLIRREKADGHLIGNHTYSHIQLTSDNKEVFREELVKTNEILKAITGENVTYIRPPYGSWDKSLEQDLNMFPVLWNVDPLDWCTPDAGLVMSRVLQQVEDGDIILLHDYYDTSVTAALMIVDEMKKQGYEFVTVEEILFD